MKQDELMTRETLALKLKVDPRTIYNLQKKGLPVVWVGDLPRYDYKEVRKWLKTYKIQAIDKE